MKPLDSSYAKVRQAEGHAQALHDEIRTFQQGGGLRIAGEPDPESTDYVFRVKASEELPILDWGCRIGDVIHNLHSALDHLAWQLVVFRKGWAFAEQEAKKISFPIALTSNDFKSLPVIQMIDPAHLTTLRGRQPYQRGSRSRAEGDPLAELKSLSNIDKHRIIHTTFVALRDFPFQVHNVRDYEISRIVTPPRETPLVEDQELARVEGTITGTQPEIEGHAKLTGHIAFSDGTPLQHKLDQLGRAVRHVLDQFKTAL